MLPSRGFFKKNDCPFFEKGLCVRPHCHFRHKKKVVSENSSSLDSQEDLLLSESIADIPLVNSINNESVPISTSSLSNNKTEHSNDGADLKDQPSHNSLFAKLVNQSNPYERISRHIPCAYTPTPQIRSAQPKNRTISAKNTSISKPTESLPKTQISINSCKSVNNKQDDGECNEVKNSCKSDLSNKLEYEQNNTFSVIQQNSALSSANKISLCDSKFSDSYEPQPTVKSINSNVEDNTVDGCMSSYVPSKVTTSESKYVPDSDLPLSGEYVPSKEKPKKSQYVPESSGSIKNQATYKPSNKTCSGESQYQPGTSNCIADYVPTEKLESRPTGSWLGENKNELTEFEFISSEIEMMKELLRDKPEGTKHQSDSKTEILEEKILNKEKSHKDRSSRSHHSSSSKHRSESSSSKSKHSSSSKHSSKSSSSSSRHHSSSSSRHHSSSKTSRSHRSSSESRKKSSSSSHGKSKHHKSGSRRSRERTSQTRHKEDKEKKDMRRSNNKKTEEETKSSEEETRGGADGLGSDSWGEEEEASDAESEVGSKKRKNVWDDEERRLKLLKKAEEDFFDDLEDDDPDTVEKQCLEIFNSYSPAVEANCLQKPNDISVPSEDYETSVQAKKRTAHSTSTMSDHSVLRHKTARKSIKSAQEVMLERYKAAEKSKEVPAPAPAAQPAPILGLNRPSIRIAAVSNIQQMLQAKKAIQEKINQGLKVNERTTIAQTVSRGGARVAHMPAKKEKMEKPTVTCGSKQVPQIKRQIYLDKLLLETNKIYPTKEESAEEAVRLEEDVFKLNSGSSAAYHAAFISLLMKTRRRVAAVQGEPARSTSSRLKVSHYDILSGGKKNFSVIKTKKVDLSMLSERHIYEELLRCKLTAEELKENGYPIESDRAGYASCAFNFELKYYDKYLYIKKLTGNRRYCIRCSKQYEVDPDTLRQYKEGPETCCYHPGKKKSGGRNCDRVYNCCNTSSTEGCATHIRHVTDCNDYENFPNCVKTLSKESDSNPGIFALDCEMVYTRLGCELARVTVVNLKKEVVYDTLVKPKHPIDCYNTFYSGIEEKMMEGVETTLKDVQAVLLSMFSNKTILVGHSLDSDLRALHLIHDTVVDTAIVYKNEKYHPYKYSLKDLCARKISKIIQENVGGHDSAEDAIAALEIMLNHVKEEVGKYDSLESYESDRVK